MFSQGHGSMPRKISTPRFQQHSYHEQPVASRARTGRGEEGFSCRGTVFQRRYAKLKFVDMNCLFIWVEGLYSLPANLFELGSEGLKVQILNITPLPVSHP